MNYIISTGRLVYADIKVKRKTLKTSGLEKISEKRVLSKILPSPMSITCMGFPVFYLLVLRGLLPLNEMTS